MSPRDDNDWQHQSITSQINAHVEVLANILHKHSQCLSDLQSIGVHLNIPMGVRQRLIQLHGDRARDWLLLLGNHNHDQGDSDPVVDFGD